MNLPKLTYEVTSRRPSSLVGTVGPRPVDIHDDDTSPWQDYRASVARVADERPFALVCESCGTELDVPAPAHSPRCEADA